MPIYRAEVVIAADHYVCLQLPAHLPEGRATVTVEYPDPPDDAPPVESGPEDDSRDETEWWDELEGDSG